ncbi:MAG: hypothetical protein ACI4DV_05680 [Lachnospiraceae bacterium]
MGKGKQLSINLIAQLISFALNLGISFFLTPFVIEYIGKDVYGFVSLANNFTSYVSVFTVALNGILSRYVTIAFSKKDYQSACKYLSTVLFANCAVMLLLMPISIIFVVNLEIFINLSQGVELDIKVLFLLTFVSFLINLPGCCYNTATYATNRLDKSNLCNMIGSVIRIAIIIVLLLTMTPHVWYVGLGALISTLFIIFMNMRYKKQLMPQVEISIHHFEWGLVKELLGVGIWNSVNQLTQLLMTGLDLIIANLFIGVMSMSLLSYAKMIPTQLLSLISTIAGLFAPLMTMAYASNDMKEFVRETNFSIKLCGFLCCVPVVGLVVFGEDFFGLWLKALTAEEVHTVAILSILTILPQFFSVYIYPLYSVNTITTKLRVPVLVSLVLGIANVVLVFILVQVTNLGVYAVAGVSTVLGIGRILLFVPIYAAHSINVPYSTFYKPLLRGLASSLVMTIAFIGIRSIAEINSWSTFFLTCILVGILGYIIAFGIVFSRAERKKVFNVIKNKLRK